MYKFKQKDNIAFSRHDIYCQATKNFWTN